MPPLTAGLALRLEITEEHARNDHDFFLVRKDVPYFLR